MLTVSKMFPLIGLSPSDFQRFKDRSHADSEDSDDSIHPPAKVSSWTHQRFFGMCYSQPNRGYKVKRPKGGLQTLPFCEKLSSKLDSKLMDQDLNLFQSVCAASLS